MPDLSGPIQPLELASWLWLIPFFPLVGALLNAFYGSGLLGKAVDAVRLLFSNEQAPRPRPRSIASPRTVARIAVGSLALSGLTSLVYCELLRELRPDDRFLLRHLWQLVRVGPLDAGVDLAFDPLSAAMCVLVTVVGALTAVHAVASRDAGDDDAHWRFFAWFGGFVFSMLLLVLSDNALLLLLGWQGVALAGYGLVGFRSDGRGATRALLVQRGADVGIVIGVALLFWGLGGAWDGHGDYQSELSPRLAAVAVTAADGPDAHHDPSYSGDSALKGKGFLTVTALPESLVYLDDSRTPLLDAAGFPLRTPFRRYELAGGAHSLRIAPDDRFRAAERDAKVPFVLEGGVLTNYSIPRTGFGADHEIDIAVLGPTLRFREMRDQLALVDPRGVHPGRDGFAARRLGGRAFASNVLLLTVASWLILVGVFAKSAQVPLHGWLTGTTSAPASVSALIQGAGTVTAGVYLVARLGFLFSLSHATCLLLAGVGVATALFGALASIRALDLARVLAYGTMSQLGMAFVALGAGAETAAVFHVATHAVVRSCLWLAAGSIFARMGDSGRAAGDARDLRHMGGLASSMAGTSRAYFWACVALTSVPIPLLGAFWSSSAVMEGAFATTGLPSAVAKGAYGLAVVTAGLTSFGAWRSFHLCFAGKGGGKRATPTTAYGTNARIELILGALAAAGGVVLGVSARDVGGGTDSLIEDWLGPVFAGATTTFDEVPAPLRAILAVVPLIVAYAAWAAARSRYGATRPDDWAAREMSAPPIGKSR